jgi:GxxExxY protein
VVNSPRNNPEKLLQLFEGICAQIAIALKTAVGSRCSEKQLLTETQRHRDTEMHENEIGTAIVDCAVHLHQDLGPGLLETVYEVTLARQLEKRGLSVDRQVAITIDYDGQRFEEGFRADLIVEGRVIVETKSVEKLHPAHKKQLLTYLRLTGMKLGYVLNFGESLMKDGITRIIHGEL